ncbi:uncharacterized protein AruCF_1678 [Achromobacter ruhlandii]|nr:uncharacterized protein AruCF_1678 [Achromobacter ruhlandii]
MRHDGLRGFARVKPAFSGVSARLSFRATAARVRSVSYILYKT